jgi:hypothetical protein
VKQCATGEYCCNPDFDHGDCCRDGSRRFSLLDRDPDTKNTTGGDQGKNNGTDTSGGGGSDDSSNKGNNNNNTQTDDGKTEGEKASNISTRIGIAIGGTLGGLAVIGGAVSVWLYLRKKRMQQKNVVQGGPEARSPGTIESLALKQAYTPISEAEAGPTMGQAYVPISEVEAHPVVMEMDSTGIHELGDRFP